MSYVRELRAKFTAGADGFRDTVQGMKGDMQDMGKETTNQTNSMNDGFGKLAVTVAKYVGAYMGIKAVVGFMKDNVELTKERTDLMHKEASAYGWNMEQMEKNEAIAKRLHKVNTDGYEGIIPVLGKVQSRLELQGETLEKQTQQFMDFAKVTGQDNVATAESWMNIQKKLNLDLDKTNDLMDYLIGVQRATGVSASDLQRVIESEGQAFEMAGLSVEEATAYIGEFAKAGVGVDESAKAIKKSVLTLGKDGFNDLIKNIKNAKTETEALELAQEGFGAKMAMDLLPAIQRGQIDFEGLMERVGDTSGALADASSKFDKQFGERMELLRKKYIVPFKETLGDLIFNVIDKGVAFIEKNEAVISKVLAGAFDTVQVAVNAVTPVLKWFVDNMNWLLPIIGSITLALGTYKAYILALKVPMLVMTAVTKAKALAVAGLNTALAMNPIGIVIALIVALVAIFIYAWKNSETFRDIIIGVWEKIKEGAEFVWNFIKDLFISTLEFIWFLVTSVIGGIQTFIEGVWNAIKFITQAVWEGIKAYFIFMFEFYKNLFTTIFNIILGIVSAVWNGIKVITEFVWNLIVAVLTGVFNAIVGSVQWWVNTIRSVIEFAWNTIRNVTSAIWNGIVSVISSVIDGIRGVVQSGFSTVQSVVTNIMNSIGKVVGSIWDGIVSGIKGSINLIIRALNGMIGGMNRIRFDVPSWVPVIGGKGWGFNLGNIKELWRGTKNFMDDVALVGEQGPEIVRMGRGSEVVPNHRLGEFMRGNAEEGGEEGETTIHIENMIVRNDDDIRKIAKELDELRTRRTKPKGVFA